MGKSTAKLGSRRAPLAAPKPALADALFGATKQRVLALLFGQPARSFFATELIGLAGAGSGGVQRELARLVACGLVSVSLLGRQKHYRANSQAPIYEELRGIIVKTVGLASPLRAALEPLAAQIRLALIDGSQKDIDLLVVSDTLPVENLYRAVFAAETQLGRPIHPALYTSKEFNRSKAASLREKSLKGKHQVLIGSIAGS
jgi:hypothetical protein